MNVADRQTANNTLAVHNCEAYDEAYVPPVHQVLIRRSPTPGSEETSSILNLLEGTRERLNHLLKPKPLLELDDLSALAEMCAYDSQAQGTDFATWSDWCHIFDSDEWEGLGYAKDVGRWYQVGEGSVSSS